jgi:hypothetical protein
MALTMKEAIVQVHFQTEEQATQALHQFLENRRCLVWGYGIETTAFAVSIDGEHHTAVIYESLDDHGQKDHLLICATTDMNEHTLLFTFHHEDDGWHSRQAVLPTTFDEFTRLTKQQQCAALDI